jgi:myo-inositol 2-dehydrogenase / D-chiro-inositol 1-dehydrogenase
MSIRIALIGTGIMGMDHARLFAEELPGATLSVICDVSHDRAEQVARQFRVPHVMTDATEAVTSSLVDAVVIASPDETHAPLTLAALEAGKHVLCEKPLSPSSQECIRVMELESRLGQRRVQVGFMRRFDPSYTEMKAALQQGKVGAAVMLHCFHRNVTAPANFTGRMAISNSAPHEFDAARFLLDQDIAEISVYQPSSVDTTRTGAPVFMVMASSGGQLVTVEINNNAGYGYDVRAELVGARGSVFLRSPVHSEVHTELQAVQAYAPDWRPRFAQAYWMQNLAWLRSIASGTPSPIASNAWDAYCATRIAEAGVAALTQAQRQTVNLIDKPDLYR